LLDDCLLYVIINFTLASEFFFVLTVYSVVQRTQLSAGSVPSSDRYRELRQQRRLFYGITQHCQLTTPEHRYQQQQPAAACSRPPSQAIALQRAAVKPVQSLAKLICCPNLADFFWRAQ